MDTVVKKVPQAKKGAPAKKAAPVKKAMPVAKKPVAKVKKDKFSFETDTRQARFFKNGLRVINASLTIRTTDMSCGVAEADGLFRFEAAIKSGIPAAIVKTALKALITRVKLREFAFIVVSNNNTDVNINAIVEELCFTATGWKRNPGSGRRIKVWTL